MFKKITLSLLAIAFSINASAQWWGNNKRIKGNGNLITETRNVSDYDAIALGGSIDVVLVKGKEGKITLEGEENLLEYIETEVKGNTLKIKVKNNTSIKFNRKFVVTVPYTDLEAVSLGGSGNISNEGRIKATEFTVNIGGSGNISLAIDADEITTNIGGSGNIKLSGKAEELSSRISGSGNVSAYDLEVNSLSAVIAGSGNIRALVKDAIDAKVVGSGSVYYKGNPDTIEKTSLGSGSIINKN